MVSTVPAVAALDIGGTKLAAARIEPDSVEAFLGLATVAEGRSRANSLGELIATQRCPTPAAGSARELWATVCSLLDPLLDRGSGAVSSAVDSGAVESSAGARPTVIGVGVGGPMQLGGTSVSPLNIPAWRDFPLLAELESRYGVPVKIDNDAKALALGEGRWGAARGVQDFVAMVVSTGVGGGIVLDGRLLDGESGNAGHIGHIIVEPDGAECGCGARGCLEAEVSGTGISRWTGRPPEEASVEVRRRSGRLVGRAVASVANLLDLRLAVVAGSVALGFGTDFFDAAQAELDRSARLDFSKGARIIPAGLGECGPILGAAAVALAPRGNLAG